MIAGQSPGDGAAPVMSDDVEAIPAECRADRDHVGTQLAHPIRLDALGASAFGVPAL